MADDVGAPFPCLGCRVQNTARTQVGVTGNIPGEGDMAICPYCGFVAVYTGNGLETRECTDAELQAVAIDPNMQAVIETGKRWRAQNAELVARRLAEARRG